MQTNEGAGDDGRIKREGCRGDRLGGRGGARLGMERNTMGVAKKGRGGCG